MLKLTNKRKQKNRSIVWIKIIYVREYIFLVVIYLTLNSWAHTPKIAYIIYIALLFTHLKTYRVNHCVTSVSKEKWCFEYFV